MPSGRCGHRGSRKRHLAIHAGEQNLVRLPASLGFVSAASLGCRFATAYRAVSVHGRPRPGDWLAVHGCGGVGLSAVMIGAARARVIAVDKSKAALSRAHELGAEVMVSVGGLVDAASMIREITAGGAHVSLDAFGSAETAVASVKCLRPRGRHVQVGLLTGQAATLLLPMSSVIANELELYGSHGMAAHEYPEMLALVSDGTLRPDQLVGRVITLEEAGRALEQMDQADSRAGIAVIDLSQNLLTHRAAGA